MSGKHLSAVVALAALLGLGCSPREASDQEAETGTQPAASPDGPDIPSAETRPFLLGVGFLPRNFPDFSDQDFLDFFPRAKKAGEVVGQYGDWAQASDEGGAPSVFSELGRRYGYVPLIALQFHSGGELLRPLDGTTRAAYREGAVRLAREFEPAYLALGIEVNAYYEKHPDDFDAFVRLYRDTYDAVKAASPDTKVFTIFQVELLKGGGGLFGRTVRPSWFLLETFADRLDVVGLTTYPGLLFNDPEDIPADYYAEILAHTGKPLVFTEVGWTSEVVAEGWESSEEEQASFVRRFFELTGDLEKELVVWSFLHDNPQVSPANPIVFRGMGLRRNDGRAKAAWDEWLKIRGLPLAFEPD